MPPRWDWPLGLIVIMAVAVITFVLCEFFVGHWEWN